jgi:hypothetical protein
MAGDVHAADRAELRVGRIVEPDGGLRSVTNRSSPASAQRSSGRSRGMLRAGSGSGIALSSDTVYGWRGLAKISAVSPISTIRPTPRNAAPAFSTFSPELRRNTHADARPPSCTVARPV